MASIVFTYRNKNSNSYPVMAQQWPLNAENVVMAQQIPLSAENVVMARQIPYDHDFQPGGPESQMNEVEYYQSDSAENQNMPEGGISLESQSADVSTDYSSQMDVDNDQLIPEGGISLESQSSDVLSGGIERQEGMEIVESENGSNQDELENQFADSTTLVSLEETERSDGMVVDESVESVENSQTPQAQGEYQAQVENHVPNTPSRDVGSAPVGETGTETHRTTSRNDIDNAVESGWDVEDVVSDFDIGVPQHFIRSMNVSSPITYTEQFFLEDLSEDIHASIEDPELETSIEGSEVNASTEGLEVNASTEGLEVNAVLRVWK